MQSNNMDDYVKKFREGLHDTYNNLGGSPFESESRALGVMELTDGRRAEVQLIVTTDENEFIGDE
jgi:hypothetical protein